MTLAAKHSVTIPWALALFPGCLCILQASPAPGPHGREAGGRPSCQNLERTSCVPRGFLALDFLAWAPSAWVPCCPHLSPKRGAGQLRVGCDGTKAYAALQAEELEEEVLQSLRTRTPEGRGKSYGPGGSPTGREMKSHCSTLGRDFDVWPCARQVAPRITAEGSAKLASGRQEGSKPEPHAQGSF